MARRYSIWRIAKWTGLTLCEALLVAWILNSQWTVDWWSANGKWRGGLADGVVHVQRQNQPGKLGFWSLRQYIRPIDLEWRPYLVNSPRIFAAGIPLWIPFTLLALPTAYLFWRDRHHPPGHRQEFFVVVFGLPAGVVGFVASQREPALVVIGVPLLLFVLGFQGTRRYLAARDRRRIGCCSGCGYNLTGNVSGRCSECGKEIDSVDSVV